MITKTYASLQSKIMSEYDSEAESKTTTKKSTSVEEEESEEKKEFSFENDIKEEEAEPLLN